MMYLLYLRKNDAVLLVINDLTRVQITAGMRLRSGGLPTKQLECKLYLSDTCVD